MSTMVKKRKSSEVSSMEAVTFNELMMTLNFYIARASDPRLSGWEHNHYRKWIHDIRKVLDQAGEWPLHPESK